MRIGRFEVIERLAEGGMAELFLAEQPGIEGFAKRVVVKRIKPSYARDPEFVELFLAEVRLAARLDHPNIVTVLDVGQDDDGYFFAMEYLRGADLAAVMRAIGGPLPMPIVLEIARAACAGLHHAHDKGIVHRDVSPQNIFVTIDGDVKLLDFGIAKAIQETRHETPRGKLAYMAPEQRENREVDRRCDLYALGVVMFEMLAGRRRVEDEVLPPSALSAIATRALSNDRDGRPATADELARELEKLGPASAREVAALVARVPTTTGETAFTRTAPVAPTPPPLGKTPVWPVVGIALAIAGGVTYLALRRGSAVVSPVRDATADATVATLPPKPVEDSLWFQPDDYLISAEPFTSSGRLGDVFVAKRDPSGNSTGYLTADGTALSTTTSWRTHVAAPTELAIGRLAFCKPEYDGSPDAPRPATKAESRIGPWMAGRITEVGDVRSGFVTVADCRCEISGVRVLDEN